MSKWFIKKLPRPYSGGELGIGGTPWNFVWLVARISDDGVPYPFHPEASYRAARESLMQRRRLTTSDEELWLMDFEYFNENPKLYELMSEVIKDEK